MKPPPLTEEIMENARKRERTEHNYGCLPSNPNTFFYFSAKIKARKDKTLEERTKDWALVSNEQKLAGFNKTYKPTMPRRKVDNKTLPSSFFITKATEKFGFPLGKFPENRYDHKKIIKKDDKDKVDYSLDEFDMEWLRGFNSDRCAARQFAFSIDSFEFWFDRFEKLCHFTPRKFKKLVDAQGDDLDDVCNVCLDPDCSNCNQIVYCDMCNLCVHQDCYGIPFLPESSLICRRCSSSPSRLVSCVLCPSQAGAFKAYGNGQWVHVVCVLWVDETHFGNTSFMEQVQGVDKALHDRRALSCMLCKDKKKARMGACIQCCEAKCTASFHVTCARNAGLLMRVSDTSEGHVNRWVWCMKHTPQETDADAEMKQMVKRNMMRENEINMPPFINMPSIESADIAAIAVRVPLDRHRDLVYYWFMKRFDRFGAPLLKLDQQPVEPARPRRTVSTSSAIKKSERERQLMARGQSLEATMRILDLVDRREEKKRAMVNACFHLFQGGFKPVEVLAAETVNRLKDTDAQKVFAQPVDVVGYLDEIKHPMCLQTMTDKAAKGIYCNLQLLQEDVDLMLRNCAQFNRGNTWFINYGKKFGKTAQRLLDTAKKEEVERKALQEDETFMTLLLNNAMSEYSGCKKRGAAAEAEDVKDSIIPIDSGNAEVIIVNSNKRRRRGAGATIQPLSQIPRIPVEDVKIEVMEEPQQPGPSSGPPSQRRPRSRRRGVEPKEEDKSEEKPSTSGGGAGTSTSRTMTIFGVEGKSTDTSPKWFGTSTAQTLRKRIQSFGSETISTPKTSKKANDVATPTSSLRQTHLTSFFIPKNQQVSFSDLASGSGPSTSTATNITSASPMTTRSSSRNTHSSTGITNTPSRKTAFRISSATLQSPLPAPRMIGIRALNSDDDDDEIHIDPPPHQLSPEELEAEKLRCAENEAHSKFAHNQLVVVEGRAAKVIEYQLAHLSSDIHLEQRQSMMKKRREVLGEIPKQPGIYVEFFQKTANFDNFKWVTPEAVELLDLSNVPRSPKILGLKAAKEWHQKVLNGEAT